MPAPFPPSAVPERMAIQDGDVHLFGSIRNKVINTPDLFALLGDRVHPGQVPPSTPLPYCILTIVTGRSEYSAASDLVGDVTYLNVWYVTFQSSVYAVGYETTRFIAKALHNKVDRKLFAHDCYEVVPYVANLFAAVDPQRSEDGREVWHWAYRYEVKLPEFMVDE